MVNCRVVGYPQVIHFRPLRDTLAEILPLFPRRFQLPIPFRMNLLLTPSQHVLRGDVTDRSIQTDVVVMLDVAPHETLGIIERKWCSRSDALAL